LIILGAKDAVGHMVAATHLPGATAHQVIVGAALCGADGSKEELLKS